MTNNDLIGFLDSHLGFHQIKANWLNCIIFTLFPVLGFSLIAGFFAGQTAYFQCLLGGVLFVLSLGIFSVMVSFVNARLKRTSSKSVELERTIAELNMVLQPFLESIKQFESRLTELMAVLPKEAAHCYQNSISLSAALVKRRETVTKFRDTEGAEGIEAALELLKLPIVLKFDLLNSVSQNTLPPNLRAEEWKDYVEKVHLELKQYLSKH